MFRLVLRTLRFRKGGFAASFVAMFLGATIVMACGALMETGIRTAVPPQRLAAAQIVVLGDPAYAERVPLDASLVATVEATAGVAAAVPDLSFPAVPLSDRQPVADPEATLGHGWSSAKLAPYELSEGVAPADPGDVVLDTSLARLAGVDVGDEVEIAVRGAAEQFQVVGVVIAGHVTEQGAVFFADPQAQRLSGDREEVNAIGVFAAAGAEIGELQEQLEATLADEAAAVLTGDKRGRAEFTGVSESGVELIALSAVFGGLAVMVAVFIVASTLGLSIQQRQREMALLRAIGSTPGQLRRMVIGEAIIVAILATALAYLPNAYVARWLFDQLASGGVVPSIMEFHQGWVPTASGAGVALLTAVGAAFIAGRGAARARPTEALAEASLQRRWLSGVRLVFALLCLGGGLALTIVTAVVMTGPVAASTAGPTAMLWAAGLALLGPGIATIITAALRWPLRVVSGLAGYLATLNATARNVRIAGAITPIMLATGLATGLIYMQTTQTITAERLFAENLRADAVLTSAIGGIEDGLVDTVASLPEVGGVSAFVASNGYFPASYESEDGDERDAVPVQGVTVDGAEPAIAISPTAGTLADLRGHTVALSTHHASRLGHQVGDTMRMRLGDRTEVELEVVALFPARRGYETVLLPAPLVAQHTTAGLVQEVLVRAAPGTDHAQLVTALEELTNQRPGLRVADRDQVLAAQAEQEQIRVNAG